MKPYRYLLVAAALLAVPACDQNSNVNQKDGVKDALDARPNEGVRDAAEDAGDAVRDAGHDAKDAITK